MRRTTLTLLVSALAFGIAVGAAQADKAKKVGSQVEIEWYDFSGGFSVFGDVHSKKNKCERNRTVTLYHEDDGGDVDVVGTDTTDRTGDWEIPGEADYNAPFTASVEKRKVRAGDNKLVCKSADSPEFVIVP
jgi:hypothetical protein